MHPFQKFPFQKSKFLLLVLLTGLAGHLTGQSLPVPEILPELDTQTPEILKLSWTTHPGLMYVLEESVDMENWSIVEGYPKVATEPQATHPILESQKNHFFRITEWPGPLALLNRQSGISVGLSGTNGEDWLVEHSFHDPSLSDQVLYVKSDVEISLFHNAHNTIIKPGNGLPAVLGNTGPDGIPDNGDEGDIHWKIDRDMQNHSYNHPDQIPEWAPLYNGPIRLEELTYDGNMPILGTIGDNGADWGSSPLKTTERYAYGQEDAFGNEWHTLTYWDDDEPIYTAAGVSSGRQGASDGHWVYICVNPVTPVLQFSSTEPEDQFYTTPIKTYHVPKTWEQTTYATDGVLLNFHNLSNDEVVEYRILGNGSSWEKSSGLPVKLSELTSATDSPVLLEYRNGPGGPTALRTIVVNPSTPGPGEEHGNLLWANAAERAIVVDKLNSVQPFARTYSDLKGDYHQKLTVEYSDVREGWRSGAAMASTSLNNAFMANVGDVSGTHATTAAVFAKERLLRMARLEPVGFEQDINRASPSKDYLNELGQTIQQYADAGMAYDLLAACFRQPDHVNGMAPIEEIRIRDGLAEIAKTILQMRGNWTFSIGGGNTHWAHGYELALGIIAAAMPTYSTPYFGTSGGDFVSVNDHVDTHGQYWNPFPDQGITWWQAATDPFVETPGHPNVNAPLRAEALLTDNGFWTGPNDYKGDGDRYFNGVTKRQLVDVNYGGMSNAECRVELVEMDGYESPFVNRLHVLDYIRRIRGDDLRQTSVTNYIRRRLVGGYTPLAWDSTNKIYTAQDPRALSSLCAFNNYYNAASLPSAYSLVSSFLKDVNRYYGYESGTAPASTADDRKQLYNPYFLSLCWEPTTIDPHQPEDNHAPIIKPLLKHVVHAGEHIFKELIVMDPDDDELTIQVTGLPVAAGYDAETRTIEWIPGIADEGIHLVTVAADDGIDTTTAHFPMIVKSDAPAGPIPAKPENVSAVLNGNDATITWAAPGGVDVAYYIIWRDGIPATVLPAGTTEWTDIGLPPRSHTRYHLSLLASSGAESAAVVAGPGYLATP